MPVIDIFRNKCDLSQISQYFYRFFIHYLLLVICLAFNFVASGDAHATSTGFQNPDTCSNVTGTGVNWTSPRNAEDNGNGSATASVDGTTTNFLKCVDYDFNIPAGATINGITVRVERLSSSTANGGSRDALLQLIKANVISAAADRADTTTTYTTTSLSADHGATNDLWNNTWTSADINNPSFGAAFKATKPSAANGAQMISVDQIQIAVEYTTDTTAPTVVSIDRASANPTNLASVQWTVTFSESVTGVSTGDFDLVRTGLGGTPAISSVTGNGAIWTVTTNSTGTGSGTLGLNLDDDDSIRDTATNRLGGTGTTGINDGSFTGQVYTIDHTAPTVTSINRIGATPTNTSNDVQWAVTFSESVTGISPANFALVKLGIGGTSVITVSGSGTSWTVTASTGTGSGTLGLNMTNSTGARDVAGNAVAGLTATGQVYAFDRTSPTVLSINIAGFSPTSAASVQWTVTFSEDVTGVVAGNFALINTGLTGAPAITSVTVSGTSWLVTASTGSGSGTLGLNLTTAGSIADTAGNALVGLPAIGGIYTIDQTAPSACYTDDFTTPLGTNWTTSSTGASSFSPRIVGAPGSTHLQLTDNSTGVSTAATLSRLFPGAGNKIVVEFDYFSYNGTGADGIAVTLSDASFAPIAGAFGGSLGYAQKSPNGVNGSDCTQAGGCPGFNGGWLGVGIDEFGGFVASTEGRSGGLTAPLANVVTVRGSGSGLSGYNYHVNSGALNPGIDSNTSTAAAPGHRYKITVDHSNGVNATVTVERDTSTNKDSPIKIIGPYDAKAMPGQAAVPTNWILSYTGSTGANHNFHEIANLKVCTTQGIATPVLDHVRIVHGASGSICNPATVTIKACANPDCTTLYPGPVAVNLTNIAGATWSSDPVSFSGGQTQVTLTKTGSGTVNVGGTVTSPSSVPAICYNGGTAGSCSIVFSANSCTFDAVEVGKNSGTPIYTKIAKKSFTVDVLSLATGTDTRNATVDLVDQSGVAGGVCSSTVLPSTVSGDVSQTTTFPNGTRRRTLTFTSPSAAKDVRVRIRKTNNPTSGPWCSSDNFAIRPASFSVTSTNANNITNLPTPVFKAGTGTGAGSFELDAAAVSGYTGTASINQNRIEGHSGAVTAGIVSGVFSPANASGTSIGTGFYYSEVGTFRFKPWGVYDDGTFADVDRQKATSECRIDNKLGTNVDPGDPNVLDINGMYGCYFGGADTSGGTITSPYFGRFIPDHFGLLAGSIVTRSDLSCTPANSIFTYIGEPMTAKFTLVAQNYGGQTTQNYSGTWAKLNPATVVTPGLNPLGLGAINNTVPRLPFPACGPTPVFPCVLPSTASGSFISGTATVTLPFSVYRDVAGPSGPYSLFDVGVAPSDSDGVTLRASDFDLDTVNVTAGASNHKKIGRTDVRYGRLKLANANGSELLDLPIRMQTEYWMSNMGFVTNTDDSCTVLTSDNAVLQNYAGGISGSSISSTSSNVHFSNGVGSIVLKKPTIATGKGSVSLCIDLDNSTQRDATCQGTARANMPWLQGRWAGTGTLYDDDPVARATFGVYKSGPVIYLRELY